MEVILNRYKGLGKKDIVDTSDICPELSNSQDGGRGNGEYYTGKGAAEGAGD